MKTWMLALSLIAVLGFTGMAQAKGKKGKGVKGTVATVVTDANGKVTGFTMNVGHHKKNANANAAAPTTITVDSSSATVTGTLAVGAKVSVEGAQTGDNITATSVTVSKGHKKKAST
jgi:hypothetical protein